MAILTGINTRLRGSAGDWTFARLNGKTVAKQKVERKAVPSRTYAQMAHRVQWANIVNLYRAFEGNLHPSFENKAHGISDFNEFVSANIGIVPVYLTKDEARQGGSVVAGYQVTRGSLPSIAITTGTGNVVVTDISLGSITVGSGTTLKIFSEAVVGNNRDFEEGDQISVFIATQTVNGETNIPYVKIQAMEVTLDCHNETAELFDLVGTEGFGNVGGYLGAGSTVNGGIAYIHSRKTKSVTRVSTQRFFIANNILSNYQSDGQRIAAIVSYGGTQDKEFLTPNVDDIVAPVTP